MKAFWFVSVLSTTLGIFGAPACGGKGEAESSRTGVGGQGGQAGADAIGQAGSGAGPATHFSECEQLCARTVDEEGCTSDASSCLLVCATVTGYPSCQKSIDAWLSCAEDSPIVCDSSGAPSFSECESELLQAGACAMTTEPPAAVASSCESFCSKVDDSGCSLDSELGDCKQACGVTGTVVAVCQTAFVAYMKCQTKASVTCDDTGSLVVSGCDPEQLAYLGCVASEVGQGTLTGGGASGSSSASGNQ